MPGSKTYTSNKVNELFEIEMQESAKTIESKKRKNTASTFFWEVLKIAGSLLGTTYYNYRSIISTVTADSNYNSQIVQYERQSSLLINHIIGFIILYISCTVMIKMFRMIFEMIFGKRIFSTFKIESYNQFHKRIINHIYMGVSFENKFNVYMTQRLKKQSDPNYYTDLDLTMNYLSQSIYYLEKAYEELVKFFPKRTTRKGRKEKTNAEFLKAIGFSYIIISLASAQNSIMRLYNSVDSLNSLVNSLSEDTKNRYLTSIIDLKDNHLEKLREDFDGLLVRTQALKSYSDSMNNKSNAMLIAL